MTIVNVQQISQAWAIPVGAVMAWPAEEIPTSGGVWLECNGQSIPSQYKRLRELVGDNTPNYQGIFLRGYGSQTTSVPQGILLGNGSQTYSSDSLGEIQGDAIRPIHLYGENWLMWNAQSYYSRDRSTRILSGFPPTWQYSIPEYQDSNQSSFLNWDDGNSEEIIWVLKQPPKKYRLDGNNCSGGESCSGSSLSLSEEDDNESGREMFVASPRWAGHSDVLNPYSSENRPINIAVKYFIKAR